MWKINCVFLVVARLSFSFTGVPDEPTNIRLHSTTNQIIVEFKPGFHGGSEQNILVEYRRASAETWISLGIKNHCKPYVIQHLEPSTEYELRMYAINKLGNSTVTDIYRKFTTGILVHLYEKCWK